VLWQRVSIRVIVVTGCLLYTLIVLIVKQLILVTITGMGGGGSGRGPGHLGYGGISIITIGINHRLPVGPSTHSAGLFRNVTVDWVVKKMFCWLVRLEGGGSKLEVVTWNLTRLLHLSSDIANGYVDRVVTGEVGGRRGTCMCQQRKEVHGKARPVACWEQNTH